MSDELRAVVERLRRWNANEAGARDVNVEEYIYPRDRPSCHNGAIRDCITLARAYLAAHPADDADTLSTRDDYARELDAAARILTERTPIGEVKTIGRREVAAALASLFPADDGEPVTAEWFKNHLGAERRGGSFPFFRLDLADEHWLIFNPRTGRLSVNDMDLRGPATRGRARLLILALGQKPPAARTEGR